MKRIISAVSLLAIVLALACHFASTSSSSSACGSAGSRG
jgi:hypothetical protein